MIAVKCYVIQTTHSRFTVPISVMSKDQKLATLCDDWQVRSHGPASLTALNENPQWILWLGDTYCVLGYCIVSFLLHRDESFFMCQ